ncbi:Trypsin [Operophtera brumata]|uniref:Trypsin n=1 Tax=Operophtera brumata TaxID=104452 RepID=A0A0L7LUY6_OPEBR|nr:Trypsin [Operophtera brumata]
MSGTPRFLRIRLGSINYKKGGTLLPVKYLEIHPYFDNRKPAYDLALVMLAKPFKKYYSFGQHHLMKRNRILSMTHLHPVDPEECVEELKDLRAGHDGRDEGAPVVINGVLWGIISSWVSDDCDEVDTFIFANLVSATNVSTWIHATLRSC